jgi:EAL domain-containing protein (putative c-di-GMP-specific phosphodiesterase class I)
VAVNISSRQLQGPGIGDALGDALASSGVDPSAVILEITESVLMQQTDAVLERLQLLKKSGVRLAIDDFGTGYSSLSYLRQFPIDVLKIDRSFVAGLDGDVDSAGLVRSILDLSSTLRLDTVAEGVETPEQQRILRSLGAHRGQGYLFARPLRAEAFAATLHERGRRPTDSRVDPDRTDPVRT